MRSSIESPLADGASERSLRISRWLCISRLVIVVCRKVSGQVTSRDELALTARMGAKVRHGVVLPYIQSAS
jgi:hypothetical protein